MKSVSHEMVEALVLKTQSLNIYKASTFSYEFWCACLQSMHGLSHQWPVLNAP